LSWNWESFEHWWPSFSLGPLVWRNFPVKQWFLGHFCENRWGLYYKLMISWEICFILIVCKNHTFQKQFIVFR
jgi:hypothetical protein